MRKYIQKQYKKDDPIYCHYTRRNSVNYAGQKSMAKKRGVEWHFTFESWIEWWVNTGHFHERGILDTDYQMCRYNDTGPYSIENVYCATGKENRSISITKPKPVISRNILTGVEKRYESIYKTQFDGFSKQSVSQCCMKNQKTHRGHEFRLA